MADEMSAADIAAVTRPNMYTGYGMPFAGGYGYGDGLGFGGGGLWLFAILAMMMFGGNGFGFGGNGFANAIGYQNLATQNDVQRGFDNQNSMANQREILSAVTAGTAQSVAATNQSFHDSLNVIQDKYGELARDIYGVSAQVAQGIANQNECCCTLRQELGNVRYDNLANTSAINANVAQSRYEAALNTAAINATTTAQTQKILDTLAQNKIEALQGRIGQLELQNAVSGVVRYPSSMSYTAGFSPFCNSGCGCNQFA